jgi:hypothetical protein
MAAEILFPLHSGTKIAADSAVPIPRGTRPNQKYILIGGGTPTNGKGIRFLRSGTRSK